MRDYDRTRPLTDGTVQIDGVDPVFMALDPEEIFFRAFRHAEFDICELSLSSSTVKTAQGDFAYVGVPAFVSRAFRHTSIYVRTDRVKKPADLKGRKVGVAEYQLTANVWARALLEDEYGVKPSDIHWIRGGLEQPGRSRRSRSRCRPRSSSIRRRKADAQRHAGSGRDRCLHRPAHAVLLRAGQAEHRLAVGRSDGGREGLFPQDRHFPDHAHDRRAPLDGDAASLAAGGGAEGLHAREVDLPCAAGRDLRQQGDAAVHGRAGEGRARPDGRGLLALRHSGEPQAARILPGAAPQAGAVVAARDVEELFHPTTFEAYKL